MPNIQYRCVYCELAIVTNFFSSNIFKFFVYANKKSSRSKKMEFEGLQFIQVHCAKWNFVDSGFGILDTFYTDSKQSNAHNSNMCGCGQIKSNIFFSIARMVFSHFQQINRSYGKSCLKYGIEMHIDLNIFLSFFFVLRNETNSFASKHFQQVNVKKIRYIEWSWNYMLKVVSSSFLSVFFFIWNVLFRCFEYKLLYDIEYLTILVPPTLDFNIYELETVRIEKNIQCSSLQINPQNNFYAPQVLPPEHVITHVIFMRSS